MKIIKSSKKQRGFTILELMIVVTIGAILGAIALPEMKYTLNANRVKTAANDMHLSLLLARSEAIKRNGTACIAITGNNWVVYVGVDAIQTYGVRENVTLTCFNTTTSAVVACPSSISFTRMGRAINDDTNTPFLNELLFYMDGSSFSARCLRISLNGKPRIYTDNDISYSNGCS